MFCKPPHPVYIVLFRGDDTDFVGNQEIIVKITTERNISGCKAYFKYMGNIQTFDEIPENKELHLVFSHEQTKEMPLGTWDAELYLIDGNGKRMTVNNRIHMLVTNSVGEAYCPDDPQAVSVVISANKYIEDAEVSADGKTLTLTKKDGTEVSFSGGGGGGGGGGTNDYNDLENKPSINGATLTGNVNLATPEQLLLKADKSALDNHEVNTKNPHKVTAAQVGALPLSGGTVNGNLTLEVGSGSSSPTLEVSGVSSSGIKLNAEYGGKITVGDGSNGGGQIVLNDSSVSGGVESEVTIGTVKVRATLAAKADKATTLAGYGIMDAATMESLAPEYSPSSAYSVGAFVYHDGNIYQCTTAILDGGEAWNAAHWELRKLDDFFTESMGFTPPTSVAGALKNSTLEKSIILAVMENFGDADNTYYGSAT